jgi:deoxyribodipyrimidine photo-lyase
VNNIYNKIIERVNSLDPVKYASNRNFINGNVSKLSPYISRGVISTKTIFNQLIKSGYEISQIQKFLQELSWRDYWQKKNGKL